MFCFVGARDLDWAGSGGGCMCGLFWCVCARCVRVCGLLVSPSCEPSASLLVLAARCPLPLPSSADNCSHDGVSDTDLFPEQREHRVLHKTGQRAVCAGESAGLILSADGIKSQPRRGGQAANQHKPKQARERSLVEGGSHYLAFLEAEQDAEEQAGRAGAAEELVVALRSENGALSERLEQLQKEVLVPAWEESVSHGPCLASLVHEHVAPAQMHLLLTPQVHEQQTRVAKLRVELRVAGETRVATKRIEQKERGATAVDTVRWRGGRKLWAVLH